MNKMKKYTINDSKAPWNKSYDGEYPGSICCMRATGGRCYEHNPNNYKEQIKISGPVFELNKLNHPKPIEWFNAVSGHIFRAIEHDFIPESFYANGQTGHHYKIPKNITVDWAVGGILPYYDIPVLKNIFTLINKKIKPFSDKHYITRSKDYNNTNIKTRTAMVPMSNYKFSDYSFLDSCHEMIYQFHKEKNLSIIISVTTIDPLFDLIHGGMILCHT